MECIFFIFFSVYLITIAWFDLRTKYLPLEPIIAATFLIFLFRFVQGDVVETIAGMAFGGLFLGLQYFFSRGRWVGQGDIWFVSSIGAFLGWPSIFVSLYLTYLVGGVFALVAYLFGYYRRGEHVPFAPYLGLGAIGAWLWGDRIVSWFARGFGLG